MVDIKGVLTIVGVVGLIVLSVYVDRTYVQPPNQQNVTPDTIEKKIQVPKIVRDTVVKTVPKTVTRYDTIRVQDSVYVPMPPQMKLRGLLPKNYAEQSGNELSVTYFSPSQSRFLTDTYVIQRPQTVEFFMETGLTPRSLYIGPMVGYDGHRFDVKVGYVAIPTESGIEHGTMVSLSYRFYEFTL